jgi:hypothetical protein
MIEARILEAGRRIEKAQVSGRAARRPLRQRFSGSAAEGGDYGGTGDETAAGWGVVGCRCCLRNQIPLP